MSAKVIWYREAWWIRVHWAGTKKRERRFGQSKTDRRAAEKAAEQINASLALGTFRPGEAKQATSIPCNEAVRNWHQNYAPTFKPSYEHSSRGVIEKHLVPYFGNQDLRELTEADLLGFVKDKID